MQLIMAVHIKLTLFKDEETDLWLSDCSIGAEDVAKRLQSIHLFRNVEYKKWNKKIYSQSALHDAWDVFSYSFTNLNIKKIDLYDEILFYNPILEIFSISDYYKKKKHTAKWSCFDEGIFSYNTNLIGGKRFDLCRFFRKIAMRYDSFLNISTFYCMFPQLKTTNLDWEFITVPGIEKDRIQLQEILNTTFNYIPYQLPRYIYFASSSDIDGTPYGETEFVIELAQKLGRENFIIKMHPRDNRTIYKDKDKNIKIMEQSCIPWEVIQLNMDSISNTLLTLTSGSFISITAMMNNQSINGYFLFNLLENSSPHYHKRCEEISQQLKKIHGLGLCMNLSSNIDSIYDIK